MANKKDINPENYEIDRKVGRRLRRARENTGMTITQAAFKVGISRESWSGWETGLVGLRPRHIINICNLLGISANYLLDTKGHELPEFKKLKQRPEFYKQIDQIDLSVMNAFLRMYNEVLRQERKRDRISDDLDAGTK